VCKCQPSWANNDRKHSDRIKRWQGPNFKRSLLFETFLVSILYTAWPWLFQTTVRRIQSTIGYHSNIWASCCYKWIPCLRMRHVNFYFLARDSICYSALYAIARPSVRLSVTRVDQSKTVEVRITQPSPQSSPMTLVFWRLTSPWSSKGKIVYGASAPNNRGVWKIRNFQQISHRISEMVQDRTKVTIN